MKTSIVVVLSAAGILIVVGFVQRIGQDSTRAQVSRPDARLMSRDASPAPRAVAGPSIQPIVAAQGLDARVVALGRKLFEDRRLSRDGSVSCASCHQIDVGGADGRRVAVGVDGNVGTLNTPTVLNATNNFAQFWNGRAATLEEQVAGPLTHPKEMGRTWPDVLALITSDEDYVRRFALSFPEGVTIASVESAIATYERSLVTPDAPFDRFLAGDAQALSERERHGYELFQRLGCIKCHNGVNVGGNSFQSFGVPAAFASRGLGVTTEDLGRFNVTGVDSDKFKFKVPTLRNVDLTAPYFHDGSIASLAEAVEIMARYQLGKKLEVSEIEDIVAFLHTLSAPGPQ